MKVWTRDREALRRSPFLVIKVAIVLFCVFAVGGGIHDLAD